MMMKKNMKFMLGWLSVLLLLFSCPTYAQEQDYLKKKIDVTYAAAAMKEILTDLTKKTGIEFLYNQDEVKQVQPQTFTMKQVTVTEVLDRCFKGTNLGYKFVDGTIIITVNKISPVVNMIKLTGKVTTSKGEVLSGATLTLKGTTVGVATDVNGKYELNIPDGKNQVLIVSFLGMKTQEIKIQSNKTVYDVVLEEDNVEMEDVVVTGYANIKKSSFTGASVRVSKEDILKVASRNVIDALQVFDPSLRLIKNNLMGSDPNTLPEFYIRGRSGIGVKELDVQDISQAALQNNPNSPVFIMDGFEVSMEKVYDFDPNRIASITILKDAAATAIYGSRAANGVIVIETVAPEIGKVKVTYNFVGSLTLPDLSDYNLMNSREKLEAEVLAGAFIGETELDKRSLYQEYMEKLTAVNKGMDTDWLAQPLRDEFNHKHSLYVEGGSQELRFGVSFKYDSQGGVMKGSSRDRVGAGLDLGYRMNSVQIKNQITFDRVKAVDSPYGSFSDYAKILPYSTPYDEEGNLVQKFPYWHVGSDKNPLYEALKTNNFSKNGYTEFANNLSVDWYIRDDLQFKGQFAISKYDSDSEVFYDPASGRYVVSFETDIVIKGELTQTTLERLSWNTNLYLNYLKSFKKHHLNFSLGVNVKETKSKFSSAYYKGFPSGQLHSPQFAAEIAEKPTFTDDHNRLFGAFLALNYTFNDIYLLDASFRVDGSSDFGTKKKYAPFWSSGVGINIHNYDFMQQLDWLSLLKIRATYGQTGKVNFPAYAAKQSYDIIDHWYDTGNGVLLTYLGNENLKWERTNTSDFGLELGFLKDRFLVKGTIYNKKTIDLITDVDLPASTGFVSYKDNMGEVSNKGFELDIKLDVIKKKDLFISLYGNLAHNKNEILKISESLKAYNELVDQQFAAYGSSVASTKDAKYSKPLMKYVEGGAMTSIFGMYSLGINPTDGKELFMKADGTVTSTWNASDQMIIGDSEPDAQGAFGVNAQWKGFTLFASFLYEFGGDEYNQTLVNRVENVDIYEYNADKRVLTDRWKEPGDITKLKDIGEQGIVTRPTSRFIQRYNGVTFNSLTVGYDFDKKLIGKIGCSMLRIQFNMKDIAKITSVRQERGTDYPFARTYNITLNASF